MTPYRPDRVVEPESMLTRQVRELALRFGWPLIYHTYNSRRSEAGFPDLILVRPGRALALELKTQHGRVTVEQARWIALLATVPGIDAAIIRGPHDLQRAADLLAGPHP